MASKTKRVASFVCFPRPETRRKRTVEMAAAPRKSSIGNARRGIQKAHIPYRGDNPAVGKKTGIAVRNVERKSDGFEPFEEVMQQADKRTPPPLAKARKRKKPVVREEDHVDENGEMSMELDNSTQMSEHIPPAHLSLFLTGPMPYFENARRISTPNISRVLSTSRIVTRTPETNFDNVPSPRPRSLSRRSIGGSGAGPSRLSKVSSVRHSSPEFDAIDNALHNRNDANDINHARFSLPPSSPQNASFTQMDQDDDDGISHSRNRKFQTSQRSPKRNRFLGLKASRTRTRLVSRPRRRLEKKSRMILRHRHMMTHLNESLRKNEAQNQSRRQG